MRAAALLLALALLAAAPAQAQKVFRCTDKNGKTFYTEQPGAGCKPVRTDTPATPPPPEVAKKQLDAPGKKGRVKQSAAAPITRQAHCAGLANEVARMDQGRGTMDPGATARRRAGIESELARCPR